MKRTTNAALIATIYAGLVLGSDPSGASRLYDDYQKRKATYEGRIASAQKDFAEIRDRLEWKHLVTKSKKGIDIGNNQFVKSHIELCGKTLGFAEAYSLRELGAVLKPLLDDDKFGKPAAAILLGKSGDNINAERWDGLNLEMSISKFRLLDVHFSGFDYRDVMADCRDNPGRRLEYIEAIVKILADPAIRKENPLEVKNLLMILSFLKASEAVTTFVDYMFYDWTTGEDYRINNSDDLDRMKYNMKNNIFGTDMPYHYVSYFGEKYVPILLQRFANASEQERKTVVGGGGTPIHAMIYFKQLRITADKALEHVENYKREHTQLNDDQKAALDEIMTFIRERRFNSDDALKSDYPTVRTWAPSYGKNQPEKK